MSIMEVMERDERKRPRVRRSFTAEFKAEIVELCQGGRAPAFSRNVRFIRR
jgi:transposase-like protein